MQKKIIWKAITLPMPPWASVASSCRTTSTHSLSRVCAATQAMWLSSLYDNNALTYFTKHGIVCVTCPLLPCTSLLCFHWVAAPSRNWFPIFYWQPARLLAILHLYAPTCSCVVPPSTFDTFLLYSFFGLVSPRLLTCYS